MRTMKDSGTEWIGKIPQDWELRKIKIDFDIVAGATPKSGESSFWDGDIPWITPADYATEDIYVSGGRKNITQEGLDSCATSMIPAGSIIFSKRAPVGLVAINSNPLCTNQGCLACVPRDNANAKYYYYVMSIYSEQFDLFASGTTFKEISADTFANFKLPSPKYETQKKIADYLDYKCSEIDALIAAKEKTNALLRERRQSIIYEAVTKGLDLTAPMKDSGVEWIGDIPEHWNVGKLGYFIDVFNGDRSSNYPSGNDLQENGIPFLTSSNLERDIIETTSCKYITKEKYESLSGFKMQLDDIVYCLRGSVGKCAINKTEACGTIASSLMGIRCKSINPDWLLFVLKSSVVDAQNRFYMNGTCAANLSAEYICTYLIPVCSESEQRAIAEYLLQQCKSIDKLITMNDLEIGKIKEYRQSLIYEAVTGKIEVK